MNVWYGTAVAGSVLIIASLAQLAMKNEVRGNVVKLISGGFIFLLALFSILFHQFGADIIVESNLWYSVSSGGWVLFLEGTFSYIGIKVAGREGRGDFIRCMSGLGIFVVGLIILIVIGG